MAKSKELTKQQVQTILPLTRNKCAMYDIRPSCGDYRLVQSDHFYGEFAHISAASKGGQRWVEDMSQDDRDSVANRIVLCPNHHTIIDKPGNTYTIDRLREIKARHEGQDAPLATSFSEQAINEAVSQANAGIVNINTTSGSGTQQNASTAGAAPQSNYGAVRDVINNFYGFAPAPTSTGENQVGMGFVDPEQRSILTAEVTSLSLRLEGEMSGETYDTAYLSLSLEGKQFVVQHQEILGLIRGIGTDSLGKYTLDGGTVSGILGKAQQVSGKGLDSHTLIDELRALTISKNLFLTIDTIDPAIRMIPFEKVNARSTQCPNPIKFVFKGEQS